MTCRQYDLYEQNLVRCYELVRELYWESLRAPTSLDNLKRNPYLKERLIKRKFGKTKAERKETLLRLKAEEKEHYENVKRQEQQAENKEAQEAELIRQKHLVYAKAQEARGYELPENADTQGVADAVQDELQWVRSKYAEKKAEQEDKDPMKQLDDMTGLSRNEMLDSWVPEKNKFKDV